MGHPTFLEERLRTTTRRVNLLSQLDSEASTAQNMWDSMFDILVKTRSEEVNTRLGEEDQVIEGFD